MAAKKQKFMDTMFRAGGESLAALTAAYHEQNAVYKRLRAFENEVFGEPGKDDEAEIMGMKIRKYGRRPNPEWAENGAFLGFRFDWEPLNKKGGMRYAIDPIIVPLGWVEQESCPGVYRPDPVTQPNLSATLATLTMPYFENLSAICGTKPIITVQEHKGSAPRAYQSWPDIHVDHQQDSLDFYIDMPRDYQGGLFQPPGSTPLLQKDWWAFRNSYGDMYEPYGRRPQGVALPADYQPKFAQEKGASFFLLEGRSLEIYNAWLADQDKAQKAVSSLMKAWGGGSHSYCGTELVSVEFKKAPGEGWIKQESGFRHPQYAPDPATETGRAILKIYADLPQRPGPVELHQRFNLHAAKGVFPQIHTTDNGLVIAEYKADTPPPPGAKPIDSRVFNWIKADRSDRLCGMTPPPPPADLAPAIAAFLVSPQKPAAKGPNPS